MTPNDQAHSKKGRERGPITLKTDSMETNIENTAAPSVEVPRLVLPLAVTYRELHEDAAGMGLDDSFFTISKIDPNAAVKCNCDWDEGHEKHCDIVAANRHYCPTCGRHVPCRHCEV